MYLYVEQWNVTQKWMDLSKEKRREYMKRIGVVIEELEKEGIENIGWSLNDEHTPNRSDYRYIAVWKFPALEDVKKFEKGVDQAGWHEYFSQINSRGEIIPVEKAIDFLINLEKHATSLND